MCKPHTTYNSSIRSDEGLTLETFALETFYGGQYTLSNQLIKLLKTLKHEERSEELKKAIRTRDESSQNVSSFLVFRIDIYF